MADLIHTTTASESELPLLMTTGEVAALVRASKQSLDQDRYLNRGLPYVRIGRKIRYRREDVLNYLDANTFQGGAA